MTQAEQRPEQRHYAGYTHPGYLDRLLARTGQIKLGVPHCFLGNLQPIIITTFRAIQCRLDNALDIGEAVNADKLVTYTLGATEMTEVPAHVFAQLDEVIFPFELCVYSSMFKGHQQAFFTTGRWIWQIFRCDINPCIE